MAFKPHIGQCPDCPPLTKTFIVTKKGRCSKHTYLFNQSKKLRGKAEKIYKVLDKSEKLKVFNSIKKKFREPTGELNIFKEIWEEREHVSQLSGRTIPYFSIQCFAHILPKSTHSELRLNKENILLVLPVEHRQQHDGTLPKELKTIFEEKKQLLKSTL